MHALRFSRRVSHANECSGRVHVKGAGGRRRLPATSQHRANTTVTRVNNHACTRRETIRKAAASGRYDRFAQRDHFTTPGSSQDRRRDSIPGGRRLRY